MGDAEKTGAVDFCYDFASPWAYFANARLSEVFPSGSVPINRIPVYLRGFESFRSAIPYSAAKLSYLAQDMKRVAEYYAIPFGVPAVFPINGIHLLRGAIFVEDSPRANAFHEAAFRATWKDGRNVSDKSIAAEIAQEVGIDPAEFLAGIAAIEVKDKLKNNTAASIARGAFGVPTFFFRDQMFWGQDRLEMLKAAIDKAQRTTVAE